MSKAEVYLFAHPDDEFGAFFSIEQAVARGSAVYALYLTNGGFGGQETARREAETLCVLSRLGVDERNAYFIGGREGFPDGQLCARLDDAFQAMTTVLDAIPDIERLHMHAWEGGHQDHDAVHLLGAAYAAKTGLWSACRQFPLYRVGHGPLGISICAPLEENGPTESVRIPWSRRLKYLRLCLNYRSQWKSFLFLLPTLALHYLLKGSEDVQSVQPSRIQGRPHEGLVLYERRGVQSFDSFWTSSETFRATHFPA